MVIILQNMGKFCSIKNGSQLQYFRILLFLHGKHGKFLSYFLCSFMTKMYELGVVCGTNLHSHVEIYLKQICALFIN